MEQKTIHYNESVDGWGWLAVGIHFCTNSTEKKRTTRGNLVGKS